jgi:hypothetical protein
MKKTLLFLAIAVAVGAFTTACNPGGGGDNSWIIGFWGPQFYAPDSGVSEFRADGTYHVYSDYAATMSNMSGTWSFDGNVLTLDGTTQYTITKVSNDVLTIGAPMNVTWYRKGSSSAVSIFSTRVTVLTAGVWTQDSVAEKGMKPYSFTSTTAGNYVVSWQDFNDDPLLTGKVRTSAYRSDKTTVVFFDDNSSNPSPQTVSLGASETIYILIEGAYVGGTFKVMVQ